MKYKVCVVDVESGGLDSEINSILSLGAVILDNGVISDNFSVLINEGVSLNVQAAALKVNGLTREKIEEEGVSPPEATNLFVTFLMKHFLPLSNVLLVGHNLAFDIGFIQRLFRLAEKPSLFKKIFSYKTIDTMMLMQIMRFADRTTAKSVSLNDSCAAYSITIRFEERHDAAEDAKATATLLVRILEEIRTGSSQEKKEETTEYRPAININ